MQLPDMNFLPYGYAGLFLTSFLASTLLPLGSDALLVLLVAGGFNVFYVIMVASVGNYLGACTSYYLGLAGRMHIITKYFRISDADMANAEKWFKKYGSWSLLFTWLPVVGDAIPVFAGIAGFRFWVFSVLVFAGKFIRYAALAYIVYAGIKIM